MCSDGYPAKELKGDDSVGKYESDPDYDYDYDYDPMEVDSEDEHEDHHSRVSEAQCPTGIVVIPS
jgi:hypothetical protein